MVDKPSVAVIALGLNDSANAAFSANALSSVQALLAGGVQKVFIVGPWPVRDSVAANYTAHGPLLAAVATATGQSFIDTLNPVPWVYGDGYAAHTTGLGNSDLITNSDGTHPSPYGKEYYAWRIAQGIISTGRL